VFIALSYVNKRTKSATVPEVVNGRTDRIARLLAAMPENSFPIDGGGRQGGGGMANFPLND